MSDKKIENEVTRAMLLEKGVKFTIPVRGLFARLTGKKERSFCMYQSYLGTLLHLHKVYTSIQIDEQAMDGLSWMNEGKKSYRHARKLAKIVAIAYLNSRWKIRLLSGFYTWYFLYRITPEKMLGLVKMIIVDMNNMQDFIVSIKFAAIAPMTASKAEMSPADNGG